VKDDSSRDTIAVVLSQDAVCLGPDGQPWSGVSLNAELARSLAGRLLKLANEIEEREQNIDPSAIRSLAQVTSILVFHDGSAQSHRAFALALDLASRSLARIQLVGVYGVQESSKFETSALPEDSEWQRSWLERLVKMYSQEAAKGGIELRVRLVDANDRETLSDVFDSSELDLIVLPRRFSADPGADDAAKTFHQSLAGAAGATILFCP
jgi:nucleotide-binding universal stress UspA family protein